MCVKIMKIENNSTRCNTHIHLVALCQNGTIMLILRMWLTGCIVSRMIHWFTARYSGIPLLNWHNGLSVPKHACHDALQVFYRDRSRYYISKALAAHLDSFRDHPSYWLLNPRLIWLPHLGHALLLEKGLYWYDEARCYLLDIKWSGKCCPANNSNVFCRCPCIV